MKKKEEKKRRWKKTEKVRIRKESNHGKMRERRGKRAIRKDINSSEEGTRHSSEKTFDHRRRGETSIGKDIRRREKTS